MIDHVSVAVGDLAAADAFYSRLLEPLGRRHWPKGEPARGCLDPAKPR